MVALAARCRHRHPSSPSPSMLRRFLPFLLLASCNFAPKYQKPSVALPASFKTSGPWRMATPGDHQPRGNWWGRFGDSRLGGLMKQAEAANPTLEVALHRVEEARALARADRAELYPSLGFTGSVWRTRSSGTVQGSSSAGRTITRDRGTLDVSYEPDLWGRVRNQARAGEANAEAEQARHRSVLLSLQGELAANYFALQAQDAEISMLKRAIGLRQKALDLARSRFKQGDAAQLDVAQAETELAAAESESIGLEKRRAELEHAIALLVGRTPSEFSLPDVPLEGRPPAVPKAVPTDLLERRPDIAAAEREMAAQNARIGVARAAVYPSVKIGLNAGLETSFIEQVAKAASKVWGLGPDIQWPIFDAGQRKAETDAARAVYDQMTAQYSATVLAAVREVEDALSGVDVLARQSAAQERTVESAQRTVELAQKRYEAGLVAYFEVLDAQRTLLRAEVDAVRTKGEHFLSTVLLIKALGGGW